jgi:hypothetical protein
VINIDCPWCAETMELGNERADSASCRECQITVEIADPVLRHDQLERAA